jgi:NADH:ubiquinone oxidoreductase subunit 2 (subunit N)
MLSLVILVQAGYLCLSLVTLDEIGVAAGMYHLMIEAFAASGAFAVLAFSSRPEGFGIGPDTNHPSLFLNREETILFLIFVGCLAGLPPLPGVIAKFSILGNLVSHEWVGLATVGIFSAVLSMVAVFRLAFPLLKPPEVKAEIQARPVAQRATLYIIVVPLLLLGIFAESAIEWASRSLRFILW